MPTCSHNPVKIIIGGFFGLLAAFAIWTWLNSPLIVTVVGQGEVSMNVTSTTINFTILGDGEDSIGAIGNIKAKAQNLRKILTDSGISESNVYESQITVVPASTIVPGTSGFRSSMTMGAKNVPSTKLDGMISTLYTNGASLVAQPEISNENLSKLEQQAFDFAMKDANVQAGEIAKSNWKLIKKAVMIEQTTSPTTSVSNKSEATEVGKSGVGKVVSLVSVSYKMW